MVPFPARQNPFSPILNEHGEHVLLAKSQYCLLTMSYDPSRSVYAVYSATTNELVTMTENVIWKCSVWIDARVNDEYVAALIFASDSSKELRDAITQVVEKAQKRVMAAPDTWSITYMAFQAQREIVKGVDLPGSLEEAAFLLSRKQFDATTTNTSVFDLNSGAYQSAEEVSKLGAARSALLNWYILFNVHKRFGTPGSRKTLNPVEQIVRRVVKAVNVFVVDLNVRVGKGTIAEGHTMIATVYSAQKRSQTVHMIRSLAEETSKLTALTTLFYGEGSSSITLFIPTVRTRPSQLVAFARTCRPKSPFFVAEISSLAPYLGGRSVSKGLTEGSDPRSTWCTIRDNCFPEKHTRKDEEKIDGYLQRGFTALATKLFSDRLQKVSPAIMTAANSIPIPEDAQSALNTVKKRVQEERESMVTSVASSTFLNKVDVNDAEVVFRLQQWRSKIYEAPGRLEREKKACELLERYLILDLETTTIRRYKRVANPFIKENYVVLSGARDYKGNVFMPSRYFDRSVALRYDDPVVTSTNQLVEKSSKDSLFLPPLNDYTVIVGHNIKFDLLHIWRDAELRKFLKRGGRIWDTMYGEYLLSGQEVKLGQGAGLEDIAKSYGGQTLKLDVVKRAWAEGKETYSIPYSILTEYLNGDLENTELIFCKHRERALAQRQAIICNARMEAILCTTEMEYNGLKTNVELAISQSNELATKVTTLRKDLESFIPGEIPLECRKFFNWSSNQHLIAFFFGGKLKLYTNSRESKPLPGEVFDRHTLFVPPEMYTKDLFPKGVFLRPPVNSSSISECAIIAGMPLEKGTRIFKAYFDSYMKQSNFRKSSTLVDSLKRGMLATPRATPEGQGEMSALANLLPRRHIFFFASLLLNADNTIERLFIKNPITGESETIKNTAKGEALEKFITEQVRKYTDVITSVDDEGLGGNRAFTEAQVTIFARDANFTFISYLKSDPTLASYIERRSDSSVEEVDVSQRYVIHIADTVQVLAYYKHVYGEETPMAARASKSGTGKSRTGGASANIPVIPAKALPPPCRTRQSAAEAFRRKLIQEVNMKPEEWCNLYIDIFLQIANSVLQREALIPDKVKCKGSRSEVNIRADEDLPVLLRPRRAFVGYYNSLSAEERKRISLMCLVGRTVGTVYDCFTVPCTHDDVVEINIKGRLAVYVPNELEAEQITRHFRSATTRQLQVGEDTLKYFNKTHKDKIAGVILELRALEKLIGTYYESTDGGTGMVSLVHSIDSCIHHELIHNKTNTGRLASANPNCQNIPTEGKSNLRDMFISRYGANGMCIEADYSQLEVVALAVLANDQQMLEDLRHNVDFHCKRVTMMRPDLKYTDVLLRAKKNKEPEFVKLRQQAKIFSFQRQYGAGVKMISQSTGLTQDQVRMLIEKEDETYRNVEVFNRMVTLSVNHYDASLQNGARNLKGHQFFKGMFPVLTGSRYVFTESDIPDSMQWRRPQTRKSTNFSPTHLKNYPVQGFAGEVVQIILGILWRKFLEHENYNGLAVLTNTVHDCVWVDCHQSVYRQVASDVEATMNSVQTVLNAMFPEMEVSVNFPCDVMAGEHMGALRPIMEETTL
ncbi:unnamed protein product [Phytomonas sp. EM1]|nr:unnamed protein product [Phytomonas sp. EM1]|eukprot:CCW61812.1 unnamed protein product [Phytomonas sp. isolate EM1]